MDADKEEVIKKLLKTIEGLTAREICDLVDNLEDTLNINKGENNG